MPEPAQALDLQEELKRKKFRVTVFGSARIKPEDPIYQDTYRMAGEIAKMGMDVVTGGGPGIMEAASTGHKDASKDGDNIHTIGINIRLPFEQEPNRGLEFVNTHDRFSTRLDEFMMLSNAVVVMPGGIGTALELFYTWQLMQVHHICRMPLILLGEEWHKLINWVIDQPLKFAYMDSEDLESVVCVDTVDEALKVIKKAKEHFDEADGKTCINWKKYGKKF
jgi:uncharacterized protein (TIGR00730 family)